MLANGQWDAGNRAAARQRAYWAITTGGELEFGYGRLPLKPMAATASLWAVCMPFTTLELCHLRATRVCIKR